MTPEELGVRLAEATIALAATLVRSAVGAAILALVFCRWQPDLAYGAWFVVLFAAIAVMAPIGSAVRRLARARYARRRSTANATRLRSRSARSPSFRSRESPTPPSE